MADLFALHWSPALLQPATRATPCVSPGAPLAGSRDLLFNSSKEHDVGRELRRHVPIPEHEVVIMMIAVGHLPDEFEVANPPMKPVDAAFASQP